MILHFQIAEIGYVIDYIQILGLILIHHMPYLPGPPLQVLVVRQRRGGTNGRERSGAWGVGGPCCILVKGWSCLLFWYVLTLNCCFVVCCFGSYLRVAPKICRWMSNCSTFKLEIFGVKTQFLQMHASSLQRLPPENWAISRNRTCDSGRDQ